MKQLFLAFVLVISTALAYSQSVIEASTATTLSPTSLATRFLETGTLVSLSPFATTINVAQARGVAGKEQLRDDLQAFNDDFISGRVKSIEEVRQPALKELFVEISNDENQMNDINSVVQSGSTLFKVATAASVALLIE